MDIKKSKQKEIDWVQLNMVFLQLPKKIKPQIATALKGLETKRIHSPAPALIALQIKDLEQAITDLRMAQISKPKHLIIENAFELAIRSLEFLCFNDFTPPSNEIQSIQE
jgi:hypothetical protein